MVILPEPQAMLTEALLLACGVLVGTALIWPLLSKAKRENVQLDEEKQLIDWTKKFYQLWCRNQWKRERYAVAFHVDDQNLDPKSWCRFPVLSAGFREELTQL